ncbi:Na+/melibiose symporter [Longilinea arvoryzae]|uniref:Na+/melibiose symporter n=1 Tax=Longilinea arvoryzae TaxID=360412 RepID=A0A0S7BJI3_9CHLR|nr:SLC45 family MFS transporter [Longilinea arvoryzae]GAP14033.1 Na+/melibiose symporter [Longilinea arvoryzae]
MKRLNYGKTFLLGFGFFGVSVIWMVYNSFVPLFLANKFQLDPRWIGFFMTLDNIAAFLIQPPVGAWSDRLRTPIGRRMPFILIGAPIGAIAFGLIPLANILPLFVACTSTLLVSMAFWRIPVIALMPDITPSRFRSQANGIINMMGGIGSIVATLIGGRLYDMSANHAYPFWMGSILVVLSALLVFIFIKEPKEYEETSEEERPDLWKAFMTVIRGEEKSALRILLAIFFWFVAYNAIEAFFTLYAQNHLGLEGGQGAQLLGQLSFVFVLFALPAGYIGGSLGRRRTILIGLVGMIVLMLLMYILPKATLIIPLAKVFGLGQMYMISILLMLAGASWAMINVNSLPMVVDMTDNVRIGTYTGLYYLFSTLAAIAGPNINGWIVALTHNNYSSIMIVGPIFMVLAMAMMLGVKRGEAKPQA